MKPKIFDSHCQKSAAIDCSKAGIITEPSRSGFHQHWNSSSANNFCFFRKSDFAVIDWSNQRYFASVFFWSSHQSKKPHCSLCDIFEQIPQKVEFFQSRQVHAGRTLCDAFHASSLAVTHFSTASFSHFASRTCSSQECFSDWSLRENPFHRSPNALARNQKNFNEYS